MEKTEQLKSILTDLDNKELTKHQAHELICVLFNVSTTVVCDYCKGMGRKYAGVTLGHMSCPKCGL